MYATDIAPKRYAPDTAAGRVNARRAQMPLCDEARRAADPFTSPDAGRLHRLEAALAADEQRARRFRTAREEEEMLLMRRPVTTERAYALFGLLLGALPPAAIVLRFTLMSLCGGLDSEAFPYLILFGLPMTLLCALMGRYAGRRLAPMLARAERRRWPATLIYALAAGFVWACATGAAGGAVVFVLGALYGLLCALPFGLAGFLLFTICHRLLARGGMIEARHFWPVACGIALSCAALILSPVWSPY